MTTFTGTNANDTIVPGFVSGGVVANGPDATPDDNDDLIRARGGNDIVAGGRGADIAALGAGDDVFGWAPADGSDTVFGGGGFDRLTFDGDAGDETFALVAAGGEALLRRDVGAVEMRLAEMERIDLFAGGGRDDVRVGDMTGSGVAEVGIDLAGTRGGAADTAADRIALEDGAGASTIDIIGAAGDITVLGLAAQVVIDNAAAGDALLLTAGGGDDTVNVGGIDAGILLTVDGGRGDDLIRSGDGADKLAGGGGDDFVSGGRGNDRAKLGAGDDVFLWVNGDGSDRVDGQRGSDNHAFEGFSAAEVFSIVAEGDHAILARDLGAIRMDLVNVESITLRTFGGADSVTVGDLSATDVGKVEIAMALAGQAGDGAADTVDLAGGAGGETIALASGGGSLVTVRGLPAAVDIFGVEADDSIAVSGGAGNDTIGAAGVNAGQGRLVLDGGDGDDSVVGSDGGDVIRGGGGVDRLAGGGGDDDVFGGLGDDTALLGAGDDRFSWDPGEGDDSIDGGTDTDTLDFDGSNASEVIDIAADGTDAVLLRNVGAVRMDMASVERIDLRVFGGSDEIRVADLGATALEEVVIDLGGPDGAADLVTIDGTAAADEVTITVDAGAIVVAGLSATIRILGAEALDQLQFLGLGGDDKVDASALAGLGLVVGGGDGDDTLLGSGGNDVLAGDAGDDAVVAGGGDDVLFGGAGDDVLDGGAGVDILTGGVGVDVLLNGEINSSLVEPALF